MRAEAPLPDGLFCPARVFAHVKERLSLELVADALEPQPTHGPGDHAREIEMMPETSARAAPTMRLRAAAVLIGLVAYPGEVAVILTQRSAALRVHSGQIAFPGGKIESSDESPAAAALREAHEEIGLDARHVEPLGYLDPYLTGTGFRIIPVVARIEPPFVLGLNREEVDESFEVPFAFLMNEANHTLHACEWDGIMRLFYAMPYAERNIWGATAGILRNLYERLYT